jgi:hypothetical protein
MFVFRQDLPQYGRASLRGRQDFSDFLFFSVSGRIRQTNGGLSDWEETIRLWRGKFPVPSGDVLEFDHSTYIPSSFRMTIVRCGL